jgi:hypothetical protein
VRVHLTNATAAKAIARFRDSSPLQADALLQRAAKGDLAAADALAQETGVTRLDALAFAKDAAESLVWMKGGDEAIKRLVDRVSNPFPVMSAGPVRAGGTVAHLTGFKNAELLTSTSPTAMAGASQQRPGHILVSEAARRVTKLLDKHNTGATLDVKQRHWVTVALRTAVNRASGDGRSDAALRELEQTYGGLLAQVKGAVLSEQPLLFVDKGGKIAEAKVTFDNARDVVRMLNDLEEGVPGATYAMREMALERGHLTTFEAFTYGGIDANPKTMWDIADDPNRWLPQRRKVHEELKASGVDKAMALSNALGRDEPTVFAMRGNTAVGKTRTLKDIASLAPAADLIKQEPKSAINPDNFKADLIKHAYNAGSCAIDHGQAHVESCVIAQAVWASLDADPDASVLVDRRLGAQSDFDELVRTAHASGKRVELYDIDAPLEASLCGVLVREPGGVDPIPPFEAIAWGFKSIREDRLKVLEQAIVEGHVDRYELFGTLPDGSKALAVKMEGRATTEIDADLFAEAIAAPDAIIEQARHTVIDQPFIARMADGITGPFAKTLRAALERYRGLTLEQAISEHSKRLD